MPPMTDADRESRGKYLDIADKLGEEIRDGKYAASRSFPSLTQIVRRFNVSRPTVMRGVGELKRRRLLRCARTGSKWRKPPSGG